MNQPTTDTFRVSADGAEETVDHSLTGYVLPARCGSWGYGGAVVVAALALLGSEVESQAQGSWRPTGRR